MLGTQNLPLFISSAVLLNLTPGQDTMYILGRGISQGRKAAVISVLGISSGCLIHTLSAALGLSAVLWASESAFEVVKWAGAAYLVYLGVRLIFSPNHAVGGPRPAAADHWTIYRQAVLTNVLNPKVALFFMAFLPQFVDAATLHRVVPFLFLGTCFTFTGTCWCLVLASVSGALSGALQNNKRIARLTNALVGGLLMVLGLRLATSRRE